MTMTLFRSRSAAAVLAVTSNVVIAEASNAASDGSFSGSRLQVHTPHTFFRPEGYDHHAALFGIPPYYGSIAQSVYYADSDLCDSAVDTHKGYPIRAAQVFEDGKLRIMQPWPAPYILMVDRGGCSFVLKVRNAQKAGAAGVVIADNTCLCHDKDCISANGEDICQPREPTMADDGSGRDISIPSFLMFKKDADEIKAELRANHMVQMEMRWGLPRPDNRVEYDLWTTLSDPVSKEFLTRFKPVAEALGDRAHFTPHMYIRDGIKDNCQGFDGDNMCFNLCTNNGRYCATDPDNDIDHSITGADVVKESLRRMCIWKHYGESDGIGAGWWDYVARFMERCDSPDYFANEDCIKDTFKHANVDADVIDCCIRDSGGILKDQSNTLLDLEMQAQVQHGVVIFPTVFVNNVVLHGGLSVANVFAAVCNGFPEGHEPKVCKECERCSDLDQCIAKKQCNGKDTGGMSAPDPVLVSPTIAPAVPTPGTSNSNRPDATQAQEDNNGRRIDRMCVYVMLELPLLFCVAGYILQRRYQSHEQAQPKYVIVHDQKERDLEASSHKSLSGNNKSGGIYVE